MTAQLTPEQMQQLQQLPPEQRAQIEQKLKTQQQNAGGQMPQECVFCKIANGQVPAKVVADGPDCMAFLDIQPKSPGHTVIITKEHKQSGAQLSESQKRSIEHMKSDIISKMKGNLKATGHAEIVAEGVSAGQMMPHYALHIIPTYGDSPDLPVMNILQTAKVPDFVNDNVMFSLKSGNPHAQNQPRNPGHQQHSSGNEFYF